MPNNLAHVVQVMTLLEEHGVTTWLFGGWAEELHGLIAPRDHLDVDLLYLGTDFELVDHFIQQGGVSEIVEKRFPHKRAFVFAEVMTEIILVQPDLSTTFGERKRYTWPSNTFESIDGPILLASPSALASYRSAHRWIFEP